MQNYLLFIDTEASGLPKDWNQPYSDNDNWPYAVQVSWVIYTADRVEVKREDHYIKNIDFTISNASYKIHGIDRAMLNQKGEWRKDVMALLADDLQQYQPLVVGHFVELDFNITGVDFYREGMLNPMERLPLFCTMLASSGFVHNPQAKYLKLNDFYNKLFDKPLAAHHNAIVDALATAEVFFELQKRGIIDDQKIAAQQIEREKAKSPALKGGCAMPVLLLVTISIIIASLI